MEEFFLEYKLTIFLSIIIICWFSNAKKKFESYVKENPFGEYEQPRTAATLGVMGTFLGITLGLLDFNPAPESMQESVTTLLNGMRSAFFTSILGMFFSLWLKDIQADAQKNFSATAKYEATVSDLINYLKQNDNKKSDREKEMLNAIKKLTDSLDASNKSDNDEKMLAAIENLTASLNSTNNSDNNQKILDALEKLTNSLVGDGDYTVIGQIKTIRLEMRDSNYKILQAFQEFGKTLAENNSKAFIEALNETMKDFNQKLTEQFGENFKQLNIAVGRLLDWQENYKLIVESVTENLKVAAAGMNTAKNSLSEIEKSSSAITDSSKKIVDLIVTANIYEQELEKVLLEVQNLGETSLSAVSNVTNFVETVCNEIKNSAIITTQNINDLTEKFGETADYSQQMTAEIKNVAAVAFAEFRNNSAQIVQNACNAIQKSTENATQNINDLTEKFDDVIEDSQDITEQISKVGNTALKQVENISNKTIQAMAEVSKKIESTSYKQREIMDAEVKATKDAVTNAATSLRNESFQITKKVADSMEHMMNTNNENLRKSTENLNKNLENLLKQTLDNFGKTMYQVSQKFVTDYTPLTNKLRELVNIARNVESRRY